MSNPAEVAWNRARTMAEKLIEALDQLDDAGGLRRLSASWRPTIREKARSTIREARTALQAIEEQLTRREAMYPETRGPTSSATPTPARGPKSCEKVPTAKGASRPAKLEPNPE